MREKRQIRNAMLFLLVVSAGIRGFVSGFIEFGYDEVYYWTYALFPDFSHFDHPPMVGWAIQFFTINLLLDHEFFIRLAAVLFGTANTWIIYRIGTLIRDHRAGLYAALLYTSSFYGTVLCGLFILPDGPQSFLWLLTLWLLLLSMPDKECGRTSRNYLFLAGLTAGLALLSKYHSVFLLSGVFFYILIYNRKWFSVRETWYAFALALLFFFPVIFWNIENGFISFTFHSGRVSGDAGNLIHPEFFVVEIIGQLLYNNPVNLVLIIMALVAMGKGARFIDREYARLILWISVPLVVTFLAWALFARTLPHWTGPAYFGFILIAAAWLSERSRKRYRFKLFPLPLAFATGLLLTVLILAVGQIRWGWIPVTKWGGKDITYDMYGWKQLGEKFMPLAQFDREMLQIDAQAPIFTFRWFPAANFDYYIGRYTGNRVYAIGSLDRIHKYHWINKKRGNLPVGMDAYYIALSDDFEDPLRLFGDLFTVIQPTDTINVFRGDELVRQAFVFRLIGLKDEMVFESSGTKSVSDPDIERMLLFQRQIRNTPEWIHVLRKKAAEEKVSIEVMIVQEARKMLEREKEVKRDFRKLDSMQQKIDLSDTNFLDLPEY